jgi:aconitase A
MVRISRPSKSQALALLGIRLPTPDTEIQFTPARVIMQDFTGVPVSLI